MATERTRVGLFSSINTASRRSVIYAVADDCLKWSASVYVPLHHFGLKNAGQKPRIVLCPKTQRAPISAPVEIPVTSQVGLSPRADRQQARLTNKHHPHRRRIGQHVRPSEDPVRGSAGDDRCLEPFMPPIIPQRTKPRQRIIVCCTSRFQGDLNALEQAERAVCPKTQVRSEAAAQKSLVGFVHVHRIITQRHPTK